MHFTKFAKNLDKQQKYLKITGAISDESELQFFTEQMINNGIFHKKDIINWEDRTNINKTWAKAKSTFRRRWPGKKDAQA